MVTEFAELTFVGGQSQITHTVDPYGHLVPRGLEDLRAAGLSVGARAA